MGLTTYTGYQLAYVVNASKCVCSNHARLVPRMHEEREHASVIAHAIQRHDVGLRLERCPQTLVGLTET